MTDDDKPMMTEADRERAIGAYLDAKHGRGHRTQLYLITPSDSEKLIAKHGPEMRATILRVCGSAALEKASAS